MVSLLCEANMTVGLGTDYFCQNASQKPADGSNTLHIPIHFVYHHFPII